MDEEHSDQDVNSMILYMRINNLAQIQYIDANSNNKPNFYDYMSDRHFERKQVTETAVANGWKKGWRT
tara:strand:- start:6 stop:209 length:204 start_codon:yes stop_codon:yes gene_type:complete